MVPTAIPAMAPGDRAVVTGGVAVGRQIWLYYTLSWWGVTWPGSPMNGIIYSCISPLSLHIYIQKVCTVSNRSCVDLGTRLKSKVILGIWLCKCFSCLCFLKTCMCMPFLFFIHLYIINANTQYALSNVNSTEGHIISTNIKIVNNKWITVEPPITDPPRSRQPLYSGQRLCYRLKLL